MASNFNRFTAKSVGVNPVVVVPPIANNTITMLLAASLTNATDHDIDVYAFLNDGVNDIAIINGATVGAGGSIPLMGGEQKHVMKPGDTFKVRASENNAMDVLVSVLEKS